MHIFIFVKKKNVSVKHLPNIKWFTLNVIDVQCMYKEIFKYWCNFCWTQIVVYFCPLLIFDRKLKIITWGKTSCFFSILIIHILISRSNLWNENHNLSWYYVHYENTEKHQVFSHDTSKYVIRNCYLKMIDEKLQEMGIKLS